GGSTAAADQAGNKSDQFDFRDNVFSAGRYGFKGSGTAEGTGTLDGHFTNYTFTNNAIIGSTGTYPAGNFFPSNNAAVGFVNFAGGDYALGAGSPFEGLGANFAGIAAAATA